MSDLAPLIAGVRQALDEVEKRLAGADLSADALIDLESVLNRAGAGMVRFIKKVDEARAESERADMTHVIADLRQALDEVDKELTKGDPPADALEDFKSTLDGLRTNVLAFINAADSADYHDSVNTFRLTRTTQTCQNILTGFVDGTISTTTPEFDKFRSTIEETLERLNAL